LSFRYPTDKGRRFRCGESNLCISEKQLCDGVSDCQSVNNNDDELLCPWRLTNGTNSTKRYFQCEDKVKFDLYVRCDGIMDCSNGEDEYFCYLSDPPSSGKMISSSNSLLGDFVVYPTHMFVVDDKRTTTSIHHKHQLQKTIA
jgi:hypothetical protein